jgi:hypothetical protein
MAVHGNKKREKVKRLADRCEVKGFVPPAEMVRIADERTEGIASYYLMAPGARTWEETRTLARSCYMQGLNDALDVISGKYGKLEVLAKNGEELQ